MTPRVKFVLAIAIGVLLAGAPVVAFNYWLQSLNERQGHEDVENSVRRIIALAEARIGRVTAALDDLARRGIDSCKASHIESMRQAMFGLVPAKEISVIAPDGRTLCTDMGPPQDRRTVLTSEPVGVDGRFLLEVVQLGDRNGQWVRIRRPGTENGLAVLIPSELLNIWVSSQGKPLEVYSQLRTRGGTVIGESGTPAAGLEPEASITQTITSEKLPLQAIATRLRSVSSDSNDDLHALALMTSGIIAILLLGIALLLPRKQPENPITELERALAAGEFVPYYQPIVDIRSGKLKGVEVLARWRKPDGTLVPPATFIPLAESSGLILELTRVLMRRVCKELGPALGKRPHIKIAFNLTARHFADEEIVRDVRQIFSRSPLRLSQLVLEVTERQPLDNLTETRRVVAALQGLGIRVAIDDVGTGHSGLSYMLKLGVDIIKIDKVFIDAIGTDRNSNTIIGTLIDLAQNMRMDIIAEGVETFEQVVALRELGIRAAQGFVFAPPLQANAFLELLAAIDPPRQDDAEPATNRPLRVAEQSFKAA